MLATGAGALVVIRGAAQSRPKKRHPDVLLISVDTLRADRLGCYGSATAQTATIDRLAAEGAQFDAAITPVPLTLPSHASMLTGQEPREHGVWDNSGYKLPASATTLPEVLQQQGYQTGGFIAGLPLLARNGLAQGFDHYDDTLTQMNGTYRYAEEVLGSARTWLASTSDQRPVFAFIHIFDPHEPYEKPLPGSSQKSYDGELAYVDRSLGSFLSDLERDPRWSDLLIVLTADHGESLGDHGERTHGLFVYEPTLRVPLILHRPGVIAPRRIDTAVSLIDLPRTVLQLVGHSGFEEGHSLVPLLEGKKEANRPLNFGNMVSLLRFGWAPLRGVRVGTLKYISAPTPEFYDLGSDPGELTNIYGPRATEAAQFGQHLASLPEGPGSTTADDPAMVEALASLGYVSTSMAPVAKRDALPDPKDLLDVYARFDDAHRHFLAGRFDEAIREYEAIEGHFSQSPNFYMRYGDYVNPTGDWPRAKMYYEKSLALNPNNETALMNLGVACVKCNEYQHGIEVLEALLTLNPDHVNGLRAAGELYARLNRPDRAIERLTRFLQLAPDHPAAGQVQEKISQLSGG